jgi:transposase InsO family protein
MRCINLEDGYELLIEINGGEGSNHASTHMLVGKAFWHGIYYPTALQDAVELIKRYDVCQFHAKWIHTPTQTLQMIPKSLPFAVWGLDILDLFPRAVGGFWYLYVVIDKFTKWTEATHAVKINKQSTIKFIKSIVCRFGVSNRIITDNRSQFTSSAFQGYCEDLDIEICYASIAHPKSNG